MSISFHRIVILIIILFDVFACDGKANKELIHGNNHFLPLFNSGVALCSVALICCNVKKGFNMLLLVAMHPRPTTNGHCQQATEASNVNLSYTTSYFG